MRVRLSRLAVGTVVAGLVIGTPGSVAVEGSPAGREGANSADAISLASRAAAMPRSTATAGMPAARPTPALPALHSALQTLRERSAALELPAGPDESPASRRRDRTSARALALLESARVLHRRERTRERAGVDHTRYRLFKGGLPIFNRTGILHERDGRLVGRDGRLSLPPVSLQRPSLGREAAIERALREADVQLLRAAPVAEFGWFAREEETAPAWRVVAPAQHPFATWQVVVDARTGEVLSLVDLVRTATGVGSVYDPNRALSPVPSDVPLERLDGSGQLQGDIVRVFDVRAPAAFRSDLAFRFPENDPRFVQTAVYRGVTDTGIFAESRGFPSFSEPITAFTNLAAQGGGELNNAFYDPFFHLLAFGNGDGSLTANLGTDLDVAAHEMGHHLFEVLAEPEVFSLADPVLAMSEGVADTFSALIGGDPDVGESTRPGEPYLRTIDNAAKFPEGLVEDPHQTGLVYGGANWDLVQLLGADVFTELLFAALARLPSESLEIDYRDALLSANVDTRGGADQAQIAQIFTDRGFDELDPSPEFQDYLDPGVPETGFLPDSPFDPDPINWNYHIWIFSEFPGSSQVRFSSTGTGDVDLVVYALDNELSPVTSSETVGSDEEILLTPGSVPSVDDGDFWAVFVFDYPDGTPSSYEVLAEETLPPGQIAIDGAPLQGSIDQPGGYALVVFEASQATVVRLEAEALDPTLDPLVGILDPATYEALGVDDDSGRGLDSLIQGAPLPGPGTYVIAVLSLTSDVDPTLGPGRYELRLTTCDNTVGADTDGDGLVNVCDDDDDDDGFYDSADVEPLDADLCADVDFDGCDDCSSGAFDPFVDGADNDGDALCDLGDLDDDNDGCTDEVDAAPELPSADDDFDFLGADCDNCPLAANPNQSDEDDDAVGDACDNCRLVPNATQFDGDDDGLGNQCDADLNGDDFVDFLDLGVMKARFFGSDPAADLNVDGVVDFLDLGRLKSLFFQPPGPGPSAP